MAQNPNPSKLDQAQIFQRSFDSANDRLRVDSTVSLDPFSQEVVISHTDDSIKIGDGTNLVATTNVGGDFGLNVNVLNGVTGEFSPVGLRVAIKITTLDVPDSAVALPATALSGRNSMVIHNKSGFDTLYVGPSNVTADTVVGTTSGHEVGPNETFAIDIQDDIVLYGRAETGKTIRVKVTEVA